MRQPATRRPGLSVFVPADHDSGTSASLVIAGLETARRLTDGLAAILVGDGSADAAAGIAGAAGEPAPTVAAPRPGDRG